MGGEQRDETQRKERNKSWEGGTYVAHVVARGLAIELAEAIADVAARLVVGGEGLHL